MRWGMGGEGLRGLPIEDRHVVAALAQHRERPHTARRQLLSLPAEQARVEDLAPSGSEVASPTQQKRAGLVGRALTHVCPRGRPAGRWGGEHERSADDQRDARLVGHTATANRTRLWGNDGR